MFLNGQVLGVHQAPLGFVQTIRTLRRAGRLGEFVSVYTQQECVYIASDGGRVCRPLIICDQGKPRVTSQHTAKVRRPQTRRPILVLRCPLLLLFGARSTPALAATTRPVFFASPR